MNDFVLRVAEAEAALERALLDAAKSLLDMTPDESARWVAGRHDWEDHKWQDHCGISDCHHPSCDRNYIPEADAMTIGARRLLVERLERDGVMNRARGQPADPDLGRIERGHVCRHGVRWPHPCDDCDNGVWIRHAAPPRP